MIAALGVFGDDEASRHDALCEAVEDIQARGESGVWPCLFAVERLAEERLRRAEEAADAR